MKKSMPLDFSVKTFFIAVIINTIVVAAHILTDTDKILTDADFTFSGIASIIFFSLEMSALFFVPVCIIVFILAAFYKSMHRESLYWLTIGVGIAVTVVIYSVFRDVFAGYSKSPEIFAAIATFSILVSLSSQYPLFVDFGKEKDLA